MFSRDGNNFLEPRRISDTSSVTIQTTSTPHTRNQSWVQRRDSFTQHLDDIFHPPNSYSHFHPVQRRHPFPTEANYYSKHPATAFVKFDSRTGAVPDQEVENFDNWTEQQVEALVDRHLQYDPDSQEKRPYFRKSKYPPSIVARFEAKKKVQKRQRNRVLAAESRKRQRVKMSMLEKENRILKEKLENVLEKLNKQTENK